MDIDRILQRTQMKEGKKREYAIFYESGDLFSVRAHLTEKAALDYRGGVHPVFTLVMLAWVTPTFASGWAVFHKFLVMKFRGTGQGVDHVFSLNTESYKALVVEILMM